MENLELPLDKIVNEEPTMFVELTTCGTGNPWARDNQRPNGRSLQRLDIHD